MTEDAAIDAAVGVNDRGVRRTVLIDIFHGVVQGCLGAACSGVEPRVTEDRERVGQSLWVLHRQRVEL